jgi:glycogen phosphorylase
MDEGREMPPRSLAAAPTAAELLDQYGCGPIRFSGHHDALYERHLLFDDIIDPIAAGARSGLRPPHGRSGMYCHNVG